MLRGIFFSVIYLFSLSHSEKMVNQSPEEFGQSVIQSLNNKDFDQFKELIISFEEFKQLLEVAEFESSEYKEIALLTAEEKYDGIVNQYKSYFEQLDLNPLEYVECHYTTSTEKEITFTKGYYIVAKGADTKKEIGFPRVIKMKNGWKCFGLFEVR